LIPVSDYHLLLPGLAPPDPSATLAVPFQARGVRSLSPQGPASEIPLASTFAALTMASIHAQVSSLIGMALRAMGDLRLKSCRARSPKPVNPWGDRFQVLNISAEGVAAEVVDLHSLRDRPFEMLIDEPVHVHLPAADMGLSISPSVRPSRPFEAPFLVQDKPKLDIQYAIHANMFSMRQG
jgi:hypothetical protein